ATVDGSGAWSLTSPVLADGPHPISAVQTDPSGNLSGPGTSSITVDTTAPDAPEITTPGVPATIGDSTPLLTGTAEPNTTVTVTIDGQTLITTATAAGQWSVQAPELADGVYPVTATATD